MSKSRRNRPANSPKKSITAATAALLLGAAIFSTPFFLAAGDKKDKHKSASGSASKAESGLPIQGLTEDEAILVALNRLGFGPRPGDVERVKQMGLQKWIDGQLHPESVSDDAVDARLDRFPTLKMTSAKLENEFPQPQLAARREGVSVEDYRKQLQAQNQAAARALMSDTQMADDRGLPNFDVNGVTSDPKGSGPNALGNPMFNYEQVRTPQRIVIELSMAKMTRAVYSERQLDEMMVDFWFNHFNVYAAKGADRWLVTSYERDAIRPNAMGKFRDLLEATAKSPAMMFYLDNWLSADPDEWAKLQQEQQARQARRQMRIGVPFGGPQASGAGAQGNAAAKKNQERGLNENYGRELMELHTLGVDGGYTQDDVINVARAFTGWTIKQPQRDAEFTYDDRIHDKKPKTVLGHTIDAGGMKDGEEVLDILARDPHTAHHISLEIAQRFVSDNPPAPLVDRMTDTFLKSDGDIREVLHTMIYSPEFWSKDADHAKIKTPFEFVASATRAVGADVDLPLMLVQWSNRIGEPLYQCEPPTGYSDQSETWVNTGALLNRMNFALALTGNRLRGIQVDMETLLNSEGATDANAMLDRSIHLLLNDQASPETRETLQKQLNDPQILQATLGDPVKQVNAAMIAGLVLGSPEFQRR